MLTGVVSAVPRPEQSSESCEAPLAVDAASSDLDSVRVGRSGIRSSLGGCDRSSGISLRPGLAVESPSELGYARNFRQELLFRFEKACGLLSHFLCLKPLFQSNLSFFRMFPRSF